MLLNATIRCKALWALSKGGGKERKKVEEMGWAIQHLLTFWGGKGKGKKEKGEGAYTGMQSMVP